VLTKAQDDDLVMGLVEQALAKPSQERWREIMPQLRSLVSYL
jgi:hypothetical protein